VYDYDGEVKEHTWNYDGKQLGKCPPGRPSINLVKHRVNFTLYLYT